MKTRHTAMLIAALAVLGAAWFFNAWERVAVEERTGYSQAALTDPYLAAGRLVTALGRSTRVLRSSAELDPPPPGASLVLPAGRIAITPARLNRLLAWIAAGGHLLVEAEAPGQRDPLLAALGLRAKAGPATPAPASFEVRLPSVERVLVVAEVSRVVLDVSKAKPALALSDGTGVRIAHVVRGAGAVTVVASLRWFENRRIGLRDHATLFWGLLELGPARGPVAFVLAPDTPALWSWLREYATGVIAAAAALLVLWLWRTMPRFGPLHPPPAAARRELLEHLLACGRFRWAHGGRASLLAAARETCRMRVLEGVPRLTHAAPVDFHREVAALARCSPAEVEAAFAGEPRGAPGFVAAVRTLSRIHDALGHPVRALTQETAG